MFISDFAIKRPIITVVTMVALVGVRHLRAGAARDRRVPDVVAADRRRRDPVSRRVARRRSSGRWSIRSRRQISGISGVKTGCSRAARRLRRHHRRVRLRRRTCRRRRRTSATRSRRSATTCRTEMEEPILTRFDPNDFPIVSLTLVVEDAHGAPSSRGSPIPASRASCAACTGVAEVDVVGGIERELTVELDPQALQAAGVERRRGRAGAAVAEPRGAGRPGERRARRAHDPPQGPARQRRADFAQLVVAERNGRLVRLGDVADARDGTEEPRTPRSTTARDAVGHRHHEGQRLQHDRRQRARARAASTERPGDAAARRGARVVRDAGVRASPTRWTTSRRRCVEGALLTVLVVFLFLNSWRSTVITGLALPVSVLASFIAVWAFGFTLEHDVAARPVARDRHPDRRRDRGAREHRAARRDGEGPLHGGARGHRRDRPRRRRDDVLDRRGVRADRLHGRRRRAVVQAVRADDRRARCSCRCSSRSRSTRCSRRTGPIRTCRSSSGRGSRGCSTGSTTGSTGRPSATRGVIAWALDHRLAMVAPRRRCRSSGALALPDAWASSAAASSRTRTTRSSPSTSRRRRARTSSTRASRRKRPPGSPARCPRCATRTRPSAGAPASVDEGIVYVRLTPKTDARRQQTGDRGGSRARSSVRLGGVTASASAAATSRTRSRFSCSSRGPDSRRARAAGAVRCMAEVRAGAGRGGRRASRQAARSRSSRCAARPRRSPGRSASPSGRWRRRCGLAFAGIDAGRLDRSDRRDARRVRAARARSAHATCRTSSRCRSFVAGPDGAAIAVPLGQVARITTGHRAGAHRPPRPRARHRAPGQHAGAVAQRGAQRHHARGSTRTVTLPAGYRSLTQGGESEDQAEVFGQIFCRARPRRAADVPHPRRAVRVVPRSARDHDVAAAVADRRDARAARHGLRRSTS